MFKSRSFVWILIFFSICRSFLVPLVGSDNAATFAGGLNVLIAGLIFLYHKDNIQLFLIKVYSIIFLIPTLLNGIPLIPTGIGFLETINPIIIFSGLTSIKVIKKLNIDIKFLKKLIVTLIIVLITGHILTYFGVELPSIKNTPTSTWGTGSIDIREATTVRIRVSSFVGTPGPYAMSLAYLFIACSILFAKYKNIILFFASITQLLSFSRSGLALIAIYFLMINFKSVLNLLSLSTLKISKKILFAYLLLILFGILLAINYGDLITAQINRMIYLLNIYSDIANLDRLDRMSTANNIIFETFYNFLFGTGTATTARSIGGEQYESQLLKIFVEWGLIGFTLFVIWFFKTIKDTDNKSKKIFSNNYIPLLLTILINLSFIQALTSAPIVSAIGLCIVSNKLVNDNESYQLDYR